jgi:hypothetical protein
LIIEPNRYFLLARGWTIMTASHKSDYPLVHEYAAAVPFWNEGSAKQSIVLAPQTQFMLLTSPATSELRRNNFNPSS